MKGSRCISEYARLTTANVELMKAEIPKSVIFGSPSKLMRMLAGCRRGMGTGRGQKRRFRWAVAQDEVPEEVRQGGEHSSRCQSNKKPNLISSVQ